MRKFLLKIRPAIRKAYPFTQFFIALILEAFFLTLFAVEGLHLLLGAFNNYQDPFAGFLMYLFRVASLLIGMIFLEEVMRHALTKERYSRFLPILYFFYCLCLSCILNFICPEIFALSNQYLLLIVPGLSLIGFLIAISQYFYVKQDPESEFDETEVEDDDDDDFTEEDLL